MQKNQNYTNIPLTKCINDSINIDATIATFQPTNNSYSYDYTSSTITPYNTDSYNVIHEILVWLHKDNGCTAYSSLFHGKEPICCSSPFFCSKSYKEVKTCEP